MREYKLYLRDILDAINKINKYIKGISINNLPENELVFDAVLRNLQIIGEASKNIPLNIQTKYKEIEWKKISGFRDILTHAYFGVEKDIVLEIIKDKLPLLEEQIKNILNKEK
ncbi:MAG: DUF86 domain-containing protein [archaeon]|nr:DUF86 domain-containing protein [archaeon]